MSTANSKLKIDFGYESFGTSNVQGSLGITGDLSVGGNLAFSGTTVGNFIPDADQRSLGNTVNRWNLIGYSANLGSTLTVAGAASLQDTLSVTKTISGGNTTITGFANVTTSVNSASLTVGTSFIANTTGVYHTGVVNAGSLSTSGFVINTTAFAPTSNTLLLGNTSGRFVISANTGNFSGDVTIAGNTTVNNATLNGTLQTISGNVNIDSGTLFVDSINNRIGVGITNPGVTFDVSGSANISSGVNSSLFTVGSSLIGNTTGVYHTGVVNADSHTVGSNFVANSTTVTSTGIANLTAATSSIRVGNSSVNSFVNSSSVLTSVGIFSTSANVGSNVGVSTSGIQIGNSTANLNANSILISVASSSSTSNISPTGFVVGSFNANNSTMTVNVGSFVTGANVGSNVNLTTSYLQIGNSTSNIFANSILLKVADSSSIANLSPSSLTIGTAVVNSTVLTITTGNFSTGANVGANVNLTTSTFQIGNSSVNTQVNSTSLSTNTGNFSLAANVGANVKLTTVILSIGNSTVNSTVNSTTFFTTGIANVATSVNSAAFTVGTLFVANTTGAYHNGVVNAAAVNAADLTVGSDFIANTTGVYHTGTINAASITIGSNSFTANSTAIVIADPLTANSSTGSQGQALLSNGSSGSPYWGPAAASLTDDISTNSSRYLLFANQTSGSLANTYVSSTNLTFNPSTGTLTSVFLTATSDIRLKENVEQINSSVGTLSQLRGVSFNRTGSGIKDYGVIAQEIEQVLPTLVHQDTEGYKSVSYNSIIGFLIEAIRELKQEINELKDVNSK